MSRGIVVGDRAKFIVGTSTSEDADKTARN